MEHLTETLDIRTTTIHVGKYKSSYSDYCSFILTCIWEDTEGTRGHDKPLWDGRSSENGRESCGLSETTQTHWSHSVHLKYTFQHVKCSHTIQIQTSGFLLLNQTKSYMLCTHVLNAINLYAVINNLYMYFFFIFFHLAVWTSKKQIPRLRAPKKSPCDKKELLLLLLLKEIPV